MPAAERAEIDIGDLSSGFLTYLIRQGVDLKSLGFEDRQILDETLDGFTGITGGVAIYGARNFRYFDETQGKIEPLATQAISNARYLTGLFGPEFFEEHPKDHRKRNTFFRAPIDSDFYLSCKGGSGSGTFSVDFAIGFDPHQRRTLGGELWRLGMDTGFSQPSGQRDARIIRTGSAMRPTLPDWEKKKNAYDIFIKRYGIRPSRALSFLAMFAAHEMPGIKNIRAISYDGVRNGEITHLKNRRVIYFDYSSHFQECGLTLSENPHWLCVGNSPEAFYDAITTNPAQQEGLRKRELAGLDRLVNVFRDLQDIQSGAPMPLSICSDVTKEELDAAFPAFRQISGKA